jgi:hypothetical protein
MAINIKDPVTEQVVRELADFTGESITDVVRAAAEAALTIKKSEHDAEVAKRRKKNREILAAIKKLPVLDARPWREIRDDISDGL